MATRRAGRERSDSLRAMIDAYVAAADIKSATAARYQYELRRNLPDWLDRPIADITPQMVRLKYEELCRRSVSVANLVMRAFRAVCRRAIMVLADKTDGTPMMRRVPTESLSGAWKTLDRRTTLLESDDLPAWWNAVEQLQSTSSRRALQALLVTGLRLRELLRLRWCDIDEGRRQLSIRDSKTGPFIKTIGPELAQWLAEWRVDDPHARVFAVHDLRAALDQAEILGAKHITPHDLRRTFLTFGERAGAPITTLKRLANHSTKGDVTLGYIQPDEKDLKHWSAAIETAILDTARGDSNNIVELRSVRVK